jgi:lysophospholipase L1-like esterase
MSDHRRGLPLAAIWLGLPVLLTQGLRVRRDTLRLPDADGLTGTLGEGEPLNLVVLGDSVAAGVGVEHHRETLAGHLASRLATSRSRAVAWQVVALTGATAGDVLGLARQYAALAAADVVVVSVGVNDSKNLHPDRRWRAELTSLLDHVLAVAPSAEVVLIGLPPMETFPALPRALATLMGARARRVDAIGRAVAAARPRVRRIELAMEREEGLFAADGFHPSAVVHERLAEQISAVLAPG